MFARLTKGGTQHGTRKLTFKQKAATEIMYPFAQYMFRKRTKFSWILYWIMLRLTFLVLKGNPFIRKSEDHEYKG